MKALKNFLLLGLMPIMALVALAGCEPDAPNVEKDSAINLKQKEVSVGLSGGTCFVEYEIVNPHDDASISVECEAEWISDFNTQSADVIRFSVAANESEQAREALVTVKYLYAEDATFLVKQGSKNEGTFAFENVDVTSDYFSITARQAGPSSLLALSAACGEVVGPSLPCGGPVSTPDAPSF